MRRRTLCLAGLVPAFARLLARAQNLPRPVTVGVLVGSLAVDQPWIDAFVARLGDLGWKPPTVLAAADDILD
jgi:hypothetical protein